MNKLEESIEIWKERLDQAKKYEGRNLSVIDNLSKFLPNSANCPLCEKYAHPEKPCIGCPVFKKTKLRFCEGSPYIKVRSIIRYSTITPTLISAIEEELYFLKSLLPKQNKANRLKNERG